jgi:hypothetical protein
MRRIPPEARATVRGAVARTSAGRRLLGRIDGRVAEDDAE